MNYKKINAIYFHFIIMAVVFQVPMCSHNKIDLILKSSPIHFSQNFFCIKTKNFSYDTILNSIKHNKFSNIIIKTLPKKFKIVKKLSLQHPLILIWGASIISISLCASFWSVYKIAKYFSLSKNIFHARDSHNPNLGRGSFQTQKNIQEKGISLQKNIINRIEEQKTNFNAENRPIQQDIKTRKVRDVTEESQDFEKDEPVEIIFKRFGFSENQIEEMNILQKDSFNFQTISKMFQKCFQDFYEKKGDISQTHLSYNCPFDENNELKNKENKNLLEKYIHFYLSVSKKICNANIFLGECYIDALIKQADSWKLTSPENLPITLKDNHLLVLAFLHRNIHFFKALLDNKLQKTIEEHFYGDMTLFIHSFQESWEKNKEYIIDSTQNSENKNKVLNFLEELRPIFLKLVNNF